MKKLLAIFGLILTSTLLFTQAALAQVQIDPNLHPEYAPVVILQGGTSADYGNYFLQLIAGGLLYLAGPVAILFIAIAGFRYVTSHGDQNQLEGAKKTLEWAIIGLVIVIFSYSLIRVVITVVLQTPTAPQDVTSPSGSSGDTSAPSGGSAAPGGGSDSGGGAAPGSA